MKCKPEIRLPKKFTIVGGDGTIFKKGDIITIAGIYEPTKWERRWSKLTYPVRWLNWHTFGVRIYFSDLWSAIYGRHDDY